MTYIGYSELTKKFYLLPRSKKESKVDITDDIKEILAAFEKPSPKVNVEELAKAYAEKSYAKAPLQDATDAEYIQDVSYYSFIAGYNAALNKGGGV